MPPGYSPGPWDFWGFLALPQFLVFHHPELLCVPVSFGGHSLILCLLVVFSLSHWPDIPELGHWLFLKTSPSQWGHVLLPCPRVISYPALTSTPTCTLHVTGAKSTQAAVLPVACLQEHVVRGNINRHYLFLYKILHTPTTCPHTTLLPVATPCSCNGGGNPWFIVPLCPLT